MRFKHKIFVLYMVNSSINLICFQNEVFAQHRINIGIAPIGLIGKLALSTEIEGKKNFSFGSTISYNYINKWVGNKAEINMRYYFAKLKDKNSSEGIYAILQPGVASFKTPYSVEEISTLSILTSKPIYTTNMVYLPNERSKARGIGVGIGYKRNIKHFFLDFNFRYQSWNINSKPILYRSYKNQDQVAFTPYSNSNFRNSFLIGPGSIFAPTLIFGYTIY